MKKVEVSCCGFAKGMKHYLPQFRLVEVQKTFFISPRRWIPP